MPIEIKELHIKVTVNAPGGAPPTAQKQPSTESGNKSPASDGKNIEDCVEQVLQILQNKKER